MDIAGLVLREGDTVSATGRVVVAGADAWFEPPLPVPLIRYGPGGGPPPRPSGLGVPVLGVDQDRLSRRREVDGAVEGWAELTGTWTADERLAVTDQRPPSPAGTRGPAPQWTVPPCPEPPGGWPVGDVPPLPDTPVDGLIVSRVVFHPAPDRAVLVLAAQDPGPVEAALRPVLGDRLCVVPSRFSRRDVDRALARLRDSAREWLVYESGESADAAGQPIITAAMTRVLPDLAAWAASVPDGLLSLRPWLVAAPAPPS